MSEATFGDLASKRVLTLNDGYRTKKSELGSPGYRILRVADFKDFSIRADGEDYVREELRGPIGAKLSEPGDVILSTKGTVGRVAICPDDLEQVVYSPQLCFFRVQDCEVLDVRYLAYWMKSPQFTRQLFDRASSTDMAPYVSLRDLRQVKMQLPKIQDQRAIAEVLGALDDKIAANERVAAALQSLLAVESARVVAMAESSVPLKSCARVVKGVSYRSGDLKSSSTALVTLKSITRNGDFSGDGFKEYVGKYSSDQLVRAGDIVVAQTDLTQGGEVIGRAVRVPSGDRYAALVASLDLAIIKPLDNLPPEYLLAVLRGRGFRAHCASYASGTTVLHLGRGAFDTYEVPLAAPGIVGKYAAFASSIHEYLDAVDADSRELATTRDQLLPLLMSGKVTVKDAEDEVGGLV